MKATETLARLVDKIDGYADLEIATGVTATWVLLRLPGPRREAVLRRLLNTTPVPVATSHPAPNSAGADATWLPANRGPATRLAALDVSGTPRALS